MIFAFRIVHEQLEYVGLVTQRELGNDRTTFASQIIIMAKRLKFISQLFVEILPLTKLKETNITHSYDILRWCKEIKCRQIEKCSLRISMPHHFIEKKNP